MKGVRGARKRGVERFWALYCPEALGIGSSVALKDKEANALRNLARLTSLLWGEHFVSSKLEKKLRFA